MSETFQEEHKQKKMFFLLICLDIVACQKPFSFFVTSIGPRNGYVYVRECVQGKKNIIFAERQAAIWVDSLVPTHIAPHLPLPVKNFA